MAYLIMFIIMVFLFVNDGVIFNKFLKLNLDFSSKSISDFCKEL